MNAVEMSKPLAPYEMLCGLLVPLYVPRATEEVLYGRRGVTLQTSREVTGSTILEKTLRACESWPLCKATMALPSACLHCPAQSKATRQLYHPSVGIPIGALCRAERLPLW